jgi:hypothetical protein
MRRSVDAAAASSYGSFGVRGAAASGNASPNFFGNVSSSGPGLSNSSNFSVRGAATFGQQSTLGNRSPASSSNSNTNTKILTGYGHYSASGIPAFPGVHGGPAVTGTERRTPGGWSWTRN